MTPRHCQTRRRLVIRACFLLLIVTAMCAASANASATSAQHAAHTTVQRKPKAKATPTIKMKLFGTSVSPLLTDGERWAIYEPTAGTTRIINAANGETIERADPPHCGGGLQAVGHNEAMYTCLTTECPSTFTGSCAIYQPMVPTLYAGFRYYVVVDLEHGTEHEVPKATTLYQPYSEGGSGLSLGSRLGSEWVDGIVGEHHGSHSLFLNWHTGQEIVEEQEPGLASHEDENLSVASLMQPLCSSLARSTKQYEAGIGYSNGVEYNPVLYESPVAIDHATEASSAQIQHCASTKRAPLAGASCGAGYQDGEIGAQVLSCEASTVNREGTTIVGVGCITQLIPRIFPWHGPVYRFAGIPSGPTYRGSLGRTLVAVQHTSKMVYASMQGSSHAGVERIYAALLPWLHRRARTKS